MCYIVGLIVAVFTAVQAGDITGFKGQRLDLVVFDVDETLLTVKGSPLNEENSKEISIPDTLYDPAYLLETDKFRKIFQLCCTKNIKIAFVTKSEMEHETFLDFIYAEFGTELRELDPVYMNNGRINSVHKGNEKWEGEVNQLGKQKSALIRYVFGWFLNKREYGDFEGLDFSKAVFIDDHEGNIDQANKDGITTIQAYSVDGDCQMPVGGLDAMHDKKSDEELNQQYRQNLDALIAVLEAQAAQPRMLL